MSSHTRWQRLVLVGMAGLLLLACGCGYRTEGKAVRLPSDLHTLYFPGMYNASLTYRVGQVFSEAVVRELRERTNYRVVTSNDGSADATLSGSVTNFYISPLTYDSVTGGVSSSMVVVTLKASLTAKDGKVLWSRPNFVYREQYQESVNVASFFDEASPALQRMATKFAKTLVANMLEAY